MRRAVNKLIAALAMLASGGAFACQGTVYLTLDTGHMEPAEAMAAILKKHQIKATFFVANEKTKRGPKSMEPEWKNYWKARADEGHAFGSHTWRHWYFRGDVGTQVRYAAWRSPAEILLDKTALCAELTESNTAFRAMTGRDLDPIWRAPGGKLTPNAIRFATACGYAHVPWTPAGFSGDELPSATFPADKLIKEQIRTIKDGDILLWHLGIWSRKEPLYPRLDELITGLKAKGLCFARITEHPKWKK